MTRKTALAAAAHLAVGAALLLSLTQAARTASATVPIVVDGTEISVPRGTEVRELVQRYSADRSGDLLSAADLRVIAEGAGKPAIAFVNGEPADSAAVVEVGDTVSISAGADIVEPLIEETRTVEATPTIIGQGPVTTVVEHGDAGLERRVLGAVSGDVFAVETLRQPRPGVVRRAPLPGARMIALTFDDGPWPRQTAAVLDVLSERGVPATFFMLGSRVQIAPSLARSVAEAGHAIGNHSYWHPRLDTVPDERVVREIAGASKVIRNATGVRPRWFRAPGGHLDRRVLTYLAGEKMSSALWTIDPQDWRDDATARSIAAQVLAAARPGAIVVLHDGGGDRTETIKALPAIIDGLRAQGYQFVTLDEIRPVKGTW